MKTFCNIKIPYNNKCLSFVPEELYLTKKRFELPELLFPSKPLFVDPVIKTFPDESVAIPLAESLVVEGYL